MTTTAPAARRDVAAVTVDGATVIHRAGRVHTLDPVASLVWRCCDGHATVDEIAADLAPEFAIPLAQARRDVATVVAELARLDLLAPPRTHTEDRTHPAEVIADPPGSCASCADRDWRFRTTLRVGSRLVDVGSDQEQVDGLIRTALAAHVAARLPGAGAEPPFLAISAPDSAPDRGLRRLHVVHRGDAIVARGDDASGAVRAVAAYLASFGDLGAAGLAALDAVVVAAAGRALVVPPPDEPVRFRHALADRGLRAGTVPVAVVDPARAEAVVGAPGITLDDAVLGAAGDDGLPWGRVPLAGLGVAGPPGPANALLTFAPARDGHRDPDAVLAALVALVATVPVVAAADPDTIAAFLHGTAASGAQ
jgi:hypothetical protein